MTAEQEPHKEQDRTEPYKEPYYTLKDARKNRRPSALITHGQQAEVW